MTLALYARSFRLHSLGNGQLTKRFAEDVDLQAPGLGPAAGIPEQGNSAEVGSAAALEAVVEQQVVGLEPAFLVC